jgi:hypothetical protein
MHLSTVLIVFLDDNAKPTTSGLGPNVNGRVAKVLNLKQKILNS